jgi:quinol-cytochrome oxidoreductase complex cytochrome b subunit
MTPHLRHRGRTPQPRLGLRTRLRIDQEERRRRHTGTEPRTARSDLPARRVLARVFGLLFLVGAGGMSYLAALAHPGATPPRAAFIFLAAVCMAAAALAAVDLRVIRRREQEQRRWGR